MQSPELKSLLQQYLAGTISEQDLRRMWETLNIPANEDDWLDAIQEAINEKQPSGFSDAGRAKQALAAIRSKMQDAPKGVYHIATWRNRMIRYAAAVVIIMSAALFIKYTSSKSELTTETIAQVQTVHDVEPGGQKAILTLSDGSSIVLDSASNGLLAQQQNATIQKRGDAIIYSGGSDGGPIAFNTMTTPRGGQYQLVLPDGTNVWLNSESSITYPVVFAKGERKVKITGEAYFEVASNKKWPFRVEYNTTGSHPEGRINESPAKKMIIEVLGTHFNIKSYADDGPAKTSLLEGSVKVSSVGGNKTHSDQGWILKPGQAFMNDKVVRTNIDQDVAWKNGIFNFNNQNLSQVMKQLARWYDLDVEYADGIPQKEYGGEIGRNLKLNQVLKGLENSGVRFELNGKRVMVAAK